MNEPRPNPFRHMGEWYWYDENEQTHGPYKTQRDCLRGLMRHVDPTILDAEGSMLTRLLVEVPLVVVLAVIVWWFIS